MEQIELLAPAGSFEALKAALAAGADAVYTGGRLFGARAYADNLSGEEMTEAIDMVHLAGKKLYLTVNTLLKEEELESSLYEYLLPFYRAGLDGILVQDFGVLDFVRKEFPGLPIHASTQMAVTGPAGAEFLESLGVKRLVAARELSLKELSRIHRSTSMELEAFVHGALCYSYSGQCLMSSMIGGRSGNRGRCAQPCRLPYEVWEKDRKLNGKNTSYPLNTRDMCTVELLPDMIRAGVMSLKIEGRMKKTEYTAGVVEVYRKYLDEYLRRSDYYDAHPDRYRVDPADRKRLADLFNRDGFNQSYLLIRNGREMMALKNEKTSEKRQGKSAPSHPKKAETAVKRYPVRGRLELEPDRPARLSVSLGSHGITVEKEGVQRPVSQPVSRERVMRQMDKTGNSPFFFEKLEIRMDEPVFVPMQLLNELRREGLASLKEEILSTRRRAVPERTGTVRPLPPAEERRSGPGELRVLAEKEEQLERLLSVREIDGYYLPVTMYPDRTRPEKIKKIIRKIRNSGRKAYLALPYIVRCDGKNEFIKELPDLADAGISGILVRNLESFGILHELNLQRLAILDAGMYTFNSRSLGFWREQGILGDTAPLELNRGELSVRDNRGSEMVLYGRAPMMITAQCLKKNLDRCSRSCAQLTLRDRMGKDFPVCCVCGSCYNIIYNSLPTSLDSEWESIRGMGFRSFRLHFTVESGEEAGQTVRRFLGVMRQADGTVLTGGREYTKGHFRRRVE